MYPGAEQLRCLDDESHPFLIGEGLGADVAANAYLHVHVVASYPMRAASDSDIADTLPVVGAVDAILGAVPDEVR